VGKKMKRKPLDKQRKPQANKAPAQGGDKVSIQELSRRAQEALKLLDQEEADAIIGTPGAEYQALVQGTHAVLTMNWAVMKTHGLREHAGSLRHGAQTMTMILQLMHYAYALGVRRGRTHREGGHAGPPRRTDVVEVVEEGGG